MSPKSESNKAKKQLPVPSFLPPVFSAAWFGRTVTFALRKTKRVLNKISFGLVSGQSWDYPDNFYTPHNVDFTKTQSFYNAYVQASIAGEFDYRIPFRIHQALWAAESSRSVPGDFVEIGTAKGVIMSAVLEGLSDWSTSDKRLYLFDLFMKPESSGKGLENLGKYYASGVETVRKVFSKYSRVFIVQGDVLETIPAQAPERISFLHLDLNHAETEIFCLERLWERISSGGIVILDDYANRGLEKQYAATNSFMESVGHPILTTAAGQGIVVKR